MKHEVFKAILSVLFLITVSMSVALANNRDIHGVKSFIVYYGSDRVEELSRVDLAILSPLIDKEVIEELDRNNVITIGYISLTTIGHWEPWSRNVSEDMIVARNPAWSEDIINVTDPRWQHIVLDEAIPYILDRGFRGVFLDNLDMVDQYPWMRDSIIKLVKMIRSRYPGIIMVVNRGFTLIDSIAPYIDAVLFEAFATYYNFTSHQYLKWSGSDYIWMINTAEHLRELGKRYGFIVLALGYTDLDNKTMLYEYSIYVNKLAETYGFIPYVAEITLTKINPLYPWNKTSTTTLLENKSQTTIQENQSTKTQATTHFSIATTYNTTEATEGSEQEFLEPSRLWLLLIPTIVVLVLGIALAKTRKHTN